MTTVLICDDQRTTREELTRALSAVPGVQEIACVANRGDLLPRYARQPADIVLIGLESGRTNTLDITTHLLTLHPKADVLIFGGPDIASHAAAAIASGARGFLRWDSARPVLAPWPGESGASIPPPSATKAEPAIQLTERELQVLRGMSAGKSNGQMGRELYLSEDTIKTHARRVYRKLAVGDRAEAVATGFRLGIIG